VELLISDPGISRRHFEVQWDGSVCRVSDLGSSNGTRVNGQLVGSAMLRDGDRIDAGETSFRIEIREQEAIVPPPATSFEQPAARAPEPMPVGSPPPAKLAIPPAKPSEAEPPPPVARPPEEAAPTPAPVEPITVIRPIPIFESVESRPEATKVSAPPGGTLLEKLSSAVGKDSDTHLYAIVDAAQSNDLVFHARLMGHDVYTLFSGDMAVGTAHVGPCLIPLASPLPFLEKWTEALGGNAGVLFESASEFEALYRHLREIFIVTDEEEQEFFFRYYDPRVLRVFLPTCRPEELAEFFGPVSRWIADDDKAEGYCIYERSADSFSEDRVKA